MQCGISASQTIGSPFLMKIYSHEATVRGLCTAVCWVADAFANSWDRGLPLLSVQAQHTTNLCLALSSLKARNRCYGCVRQIMIIHNFVLIVASRVQNVKWLPQFTILLLPGSLHGFLGPEGVVERETGRWSNLFCQTRCRSQA